MHHKTKRKTQRIIKSGVKEVTADIYEIRGESISAWGTTNIKSQFGILSLTPPAVQSLQTWEAYQTCRATYSADRLSWKEGSTNNLEISKNSRIQWTEFLYPNLSQHTGLLFQRSTTKTKFSVQEWLLNLKKIMHFTIFFLFFSKTINFKVV